MGNEAFWLGVGTAVSAAAFGLAKAVSLLLTSRHKAAEEAREGEHRRDEVERDAALRRLTQVSEWQSRQIDRLSQHSADQDTLIRRQQECLSECREDMAVLQAALWRYYELARRMGRQMQPPEEVEPPPERRACGAEEVEFLRRTVAQGSVVLRESKPPAPPGGAGEKAGA